MIRVFVARREAPHQLGADTAPLIIGMDEQMRVIDDQAAVGNGVSEADKTRAVPSSEKRVRNEQRSMQRFRFSCEWPPGSAVKFDCALKCQVVRILVVNYFFHKKQGYSILCLCASGGSEI